MIDDSMNAARRARLDAEDAPLHPDLAVGSLLSSVAWSLIRIGDLLERDQGAADDPGDVE